MSKKIQWLLVAALSSTPVSMARASDATPVSSRGNLCFESAVNLAGWELPRASMIEGARPQKVSGLPDGVTVTPLRVVEVVWVPRYYVEGKALILRSLLCDLEAVERLEANGRPFAVRAAAVGRHVAMSFHIVWVDRNGDGRFTELRWSPLNDVPDWVKEILAVKPTTAPGPAQSP